MAVTLKELGWSFNRVDTWLRKHRKAVFPGMALRVTDNEKGIPAGEVVEVVHVGKEDLTVSWFGFGRVFTSWVPRGLKIYRPLA